MTLVHSDESMIQLMSFSLVIFAVILHFRCFHFHKVA